MEWRLYLLTYKWGFYANVRSIYSTFSIGEYCFIMKPILYMYFIQVPFHLLACLCMYLQSQWYTQFHRSIHNTHIVETCYKHLQEQPWNFQWRKRVMILWVLGAQAVHMASTWAHQFRSKYLNSSVIKGLGNLYLLTIDLSVSKSKGLSLSSLLNKS